jgi:asparagine synthetase B (glutamine-hydrolysing)
VAARLDGAGAGGMLLSGGIDSTAVAAAWGSVRDRSGVAPLTGYSWRFAELPAVDERATSDLVAGALGLPVTTLDGDDGWPLHHVEDHGPTPDDPYVWMYQYLVDRTLDAARSSGVRTMITTDRGDDLTAGWVFDDLGLLVHGRLGAVSRERQVYQQQYGASWRQYVGKRLLAPAATSLWPPAYGTPLRRSVRRLFGSRGQRPLAPWIPPAAAHRFGLSDALAADLHLPRTRSVGRLHRYRAVYAPTSLRQTEMRERTFARQGLRHADPWNDRRIAEFVCAVPQWLLQRQSAPKAMVARAAADLVPHAARSAVDRPARSNPAPLFRRGFNEREVDTVRRLMTGSRAADLGLLDPTAVLASYDDYLAGRDLRHDFWSPLTVELWLRRWWD